MTMSVSPNRSNAQRIRVGDCLTDSRSSSDIQHALNLVRLKRCQEHLVADSLAHERVHEIKPVQLKLVVWQAVD
jgi:hypothetical protein